MEFFIKFSIFIIFLEYNVSGWYMCPYKCNCLKHTVDCSHSGEKEFPTYFPPHIETLDLSGNEIQYLPDVLYNLQSLANLNLGWNQLHFIPETSLQNLLSLETLNLSGNKIHRLSDVRGIYHSKKLLELDIHNNPIYETGSCVMDDALYSESLNKLDLSRCVITNINHCSFKWLTNLTHLYLSGNPLKQLTKITSNSIEYLDVSNCDVRTVIAQAFDELPSLKYLDISQNPNVKVNTPFTKYMSESLIHLDASNCGIIDELFLSAFPNLKYSSFKGNLIRELSQSLLLHNRNLINLDLSENLISSTNYATFIGGESLISLDLSSNFISYFHPGTFASLCRLSKLKLSKNPLKSIPNITSLSLQYLDLSDSDITELSSSISYNIPQIRTLNLSNNPIEFLSDEIYLPHLNELDLSYCRITTINFKVFKNLHRLKKLDIRGNRLTNIFHRSIMDSMINIKEIILTNNPWQCGCDTTNHEEFLKFIMRKSPSEDQQDITCLKPDSQLQVLWIKACQTENDKNNKKSKTDRHWLAFIITFGIMTSIVLLMLVLRHNLSISPNTTQQDNTNNIESITTPYPVRSPIADILQLPTYEEAILLPKPTNLSTSDSMNIITREVSTWTSNQTLNINDNEGNIDNDSTNNSENETENCSLCRQYNLNVSSTSL